MRYRGSNVEIAPQKSALARSLPHCCGKLPVGRIVVSFDCNRDLEVAFCGTCSHYSSESLGYPALFSDNASHIIGSDREMENDNAFGVGLVLDDLYSRLVLNEACRDRIQ